MKNPLFYNVIFGCIITLFSTALTAQSKPTNENAKKSQNYQKLIDFGYTDQEIFEDLGNAYFLSENYETAIFWYRKLKTVSHNGQLRKSYQERYNYALHKTGAKEVAFSANDKDWLASVRSDYKTKQTSKKDERFNELNLNFKDEPMTAMLQVDGKNKHPFMQQAPVALTEDGNTAYFSKEILVKPSTGIFSKKQLVHKIFKAEKINGRWKNIRQVSLSPKDASVLHPTVSKDGKRLFFASNMPGTFGKYDIYVSNIRKDGSLGIAKNLGTKVNTKENDLYPNLVGGNTLFFASEGRKGYGGMDIYMVDVNEKKVGIAVNLGSPINSAEDDLAIRFTTKNGMGYVMSNRGKNKENIHQVAFSYVNKQENNASAKREFDIADAFTNDVKIDYSSTVFEDE
ncbi:TolB family protein [Costertonia aggregata]|uniref:PD40 domain-containing protein n=1 Tax=Costertonia aggregata TaxID=343403 RepID=A0A7H9ATI3_9FLAO|nr:PD40 domain-containing protein [Costertonia aggregata]QLG46652.1 PD40 domain-containing protein [Costertonia aggregata]